MSYCDHILEMGGFFPIHGLYRPAVIVYIDMPGSGIYHRFYTNHHSFGQFFALAGSAVGQSPVFSSIAVDDSSVDSVSGSSSTSKPFGLPSSDCGPEEVKAGLPQALESGKRECEARNRPESVMEGLSAVGKKPCSDARVQRIVVFYEDGTFEAYAPR